MIAICAMNYNFCRIHQNLRVTQAMKSVIANHVWILEEIAAWSDSTRTPKLPVVAGRTRLAGVRPSSGAATGFIQATEHFPAARPPHLAAAGTAALRQRSNSTAEFGFKAAHCPGFNTGWPYDPCHGR
jgi:hypothetical protein